MTEVTPVAIIRLSSIPFRILTDRSMRPVRHLILLAAILVISLSQNLSYYGPLQSIPSGGIYWLSLSSAAAYLAVAYLHIYVLAPRLLAKKEYALYFLYSVALIAGLGVVKLLQNDLVVGLWDISTRPFGMVTVLDSLSDFALNLLCFTGVSLTVLLKYWLQEENRISELESGKLVVEVETVRNSVDPEMLLGTLHKCGVESREDPAHSAGMLLKLSELLRYQLYESAKEKVFLDSEVAFIRNYLELEKERAGEPGHTLIVEGSGMVYVPPLLFMPVIKAVLQHRKAGDRLDVRISTGPDCISFRCNCPGDIPAGEMNIAMKGLVHRYGEKLQYGTEDPGRIIIDISNG